MNGFTFSWFRRHPLASCFVLITAVLAAGLLSADAGVATAQVLPFPFLPLAPLSTVAVPAPIGGDIIDTPAGRAAAISLGKALFWDIQLGGHGQTACAPCHFRGGADNRPAINPGLDKLFGTADDVHGSVALAQATFGQVDPATGLPISGIDPNPLNPADRCTPGVNAIFGVNPQVTTRNAPTTVNG